MTFPPHPPTLLERLERYKIWIFRSNVIAQMHKAFSPLLVQNVTLAQVQNTGTGKLTSFYFNHFHLLQGHTQKHIWLS